MKKPYEATPQGLVLTVKAKPRSSRAGIDGADEEAVRVRVRSAPVDGKANREIIETVAEAFGVAKSRVAFKSGETSKTKRLVVAGAGEEDAKRVLGI